MVNRVTTAIDHKETELIAKLDAGTITQEKIDEVSNNFDMDTEEFCRFQDVKSIAVDSGKLTVEEGCTIYRKLGSTPSVFNAQPLSVKVTLTRIFSELL